MLTFNIDNMVPQEFPFPAPIMDYILKNVTAPQLLKLYQCSKFFYDKFRLNIIENLELRCRKDEQRIVGNSLAIWHQNPAWLKLQNIWVSNSFKVVDWDGNFDIANTKFSRLTFDKLEFVTGNSFMGNTFLVKTPTLRHLIISDGLKVGIDKIIEQAPHVSGFAISLNDASVIDMKKLISLERQTKITYFHLLSVHTIPDPTLVIEFFKKHAIPEIDYYFDLHVGNLHDDAAFHETVNHGIRKWKCSFKVCRRFSHFVDLSGKTAFICGATNDIGRATTILFRKLGASVVAIARNYFDLMSLAEECQKIKSRGQISTVTIDLTDEFDIYKIHDSICYKLGGNLDILVVNTDTSCWSNVTDFELQKQHHNSSNILEGHIELIEAVDGYLHDSRGTVINILSSVAVKDPEDINLIYRLENKIKMRELELKEKDVRINVIDPGTFPAALIKIAREIKKYEDMDVKELKKAHEDQIADAAAFLASDAAKLIQGAILPVNPLNLLSSP